MTAEPTPPPKRRNGIPRGGGATRTLPPPSFTHRPPNACLPLQQRQRPPLAAPARAPKSRQTPALGAARRHPRWQARACGKRFAQRCGGTRPARRRGSPSGEGEAHRRQRRAQRCQTRLLRPRSPPPSLQFPPPLPHPPSPPRPQRRSPPPPRHPHHLPRSLPPPAPPVIGADGPARQPLVPPRSAASAPGPARQRRGQRPRPRSTTRTPLCPHPVPAVAESVVVAACFPHFRRHAHPRCRGGRTQRDAPPAATSAVPCPTREWGQMQRSVRHPHQWAPRGPRTPAAVPQGQA